MAYHSIRPEQLQHLSMFGFETVSENDEFLCVHSFSRGTEIIQKSNPMKDESYKNDKFTILNIDDK